VSNFDGTVDRTGADEVRIEVGAEGNGSSLAFSPAAVHVDPGTTVVWEWTGDGGGGHNVYSDDPAFESPTQSEAGATYGLEFDGEGVCRYACAPHEGAGMKGAVVVGEPSAAGGGGIVDIETVLWGLAGSIVAAPFIASQIVANRRRDDEERPGGRPGNPAD
jgi:halocyanin-like protein